MLGRRRFLVLALTFGLSLGLVAEDVLAQTTTGKTCICVTPHKRGGKTTGKTPGGRRPSKMTVKYGSTTASHTSNGGETPTQVAQDLANQLAAAGHSVGPVTTDPVTGRAVFCINGKTPRGGVRTSENDTGIKEVTHRRVTSPRDWFLRNVAGAFTFASLPAAGGKFTLEVIAATADGGEVYVDATVTTVAGQTGASVTENLIAQLNELGFEATLTEFDFGDGDGTVAAIDIQPGVYEGIYGIGEITADANLGELRLASWNEEGIDGLDLDGNGVLDEGDVETFLGLIRAEDPRADLTGDGRADLRDLRLFVEDLTANRPRALRPSR